MYKPNLNLHIMRKKVICIFILLGCCMFCSAQQVVSSGGYHVKPEISIDWVLGGSLSAIPDYNPVAPSTPMKEPMESLLTLKVYPAPAVDFINIEITPADTGRFILEIFDNEGTKVLNKVFINQSVVQVNISDIPAGVYYLKVFFPSQDQSFKIEKIVKTQTNHL